MTNTLHGLPRKTLSAMFQKARVPVRSSHDDHHNQVDGVLLCITDDFGVEFPRAS